MTRQKTPVLFLLILCFLLCACQPTPTEEAVVSHADSKLEQAVTAPAVQAYTYEAPARWEEIYRPRNREVRFSASVEVPTAEQFPIVTIRRHRLTADDVIGFLQSLCTGEWIVRENEYSREELTADLKAASNMYLGEDDKTGEPVYGANEEEMRRIQKLIEQAPVEDTCAPFTADSVSFPINNVPVKDSGGTVWYLTAQSKESRSFLSLRRRRDTAVYPEQWVLQPDSNVYRPNGLKNIRITEAEAIAKGDALIAALGLADYRVAEVTKALEYQRYSLADRSEGYLLRYVPALDGTVPCFYGMSSNPSFLQFTDGDATYAPPWKQEYAELYVTEEGVLSFAWTDPKEHVMTANENVKLLPFDEIQSRVKKLLEYGLGDFEGSPVLVKRIVLSTSVAQIKNQGDEAFFVPTWVFFLTTEQDEEIHSDLCVLLINAIDGTYIDRR